MGQQEPTQTKTPRDAFRLLEFIKYLLDTNRHSIWNDIDLRFRHVKHDHHLFRVFLNLEFVIITWDLRRKAALSGPLWMLKIVPSALQNRRTHSAGRVIISQSPQG